MIELTRGNFSDLYGTLFKRLEHAAFIAVDMQYNASVPVISEKTDLKDKYAALREYIFANEMVGVYFSVVAYYASKQQRKCTAYSYGSYVRHEGSYRKTGSFTSRGLQHLKAANFDFNKFFRDSIKYLNKAEEERLRNELYTYARLSPARREGFYHQDDSFLKKYLVDEDIRKMITDYCHQVEKFMSHAKEGSVMPLNGTDSKKLVPYYLLKKEILGLYPSVWLTTKDYTMCVECYSSLQRSKYETEDLRTMKQEHYVVEPLVAFRKVFRHLRGLEVPVIGDGILLALMVMYDELEDRLPESLEAFLAALQFRGEPIDTRYLSECMRSVCEASRRPDSLALDDMFSYLRNGPGLPLTEQSPHVVEAEVTADADEDGRTFACKGNAYKAGYLYVRMTPFLRKRGIHMRPVFEASRDVAVALPISGEDADLGAGGDATASGAEREERGAVVEGGAAMSPPVKRAACETAASPPELRSTSERSESSTVESPGPQPVARGLGRGRFLKLQAARA